jgi:hypothetical protein
MAMDCSVLNDVLFAIPQCETVQRQEQRQQDTDQYLGAGGHTEVVPGKESCSWPPWPEGA